MSKRFTGDSTHRLPAGMIEPYRIWFEFLRLAHKDPRLKVNKRVYARWGKVEGTDFREWWELNWRSLFGVPVGVMKVEPTQIASMTKEISNRVILAIDPYAPTRPTIAEIRDCLKSARRGRKNARPQGMFALSGKTQVKRLNLRQALKFYEFWLAEQDIDRTVDRYLKWARDWNTRLQAKKSKRTKIAFPPYFTSYGESKTKREKDRDFERRKIRRLLQRARTIAANVAKGEFPGRY